MVISGALLLSLVGWGVIGGDTKRNVGQLVGKVEHINTNHDVKNTRNKRSYGLTTDGYGVVGGILVGVLGLLTHGGIGNTFRRWGNGPVFPQRPKYPHSAKIKRRRPRQTVVN